MNPLVNGSFKEGLKKKKKKGKKLAILSQPINVGICSAFRLMSESWGP